MHVLQLRFSLLCCHGDDAGTLSPAPVTLTLALALKHLQQPLDALVPGAQRLLLRVDSQLHLLHGLLQQEQLLGLPLVLQLKLEEVFLRLILRGRRGEAVAPGYLAGTAGPERAAAGRRRWTLAGSVVLLIWAAPRPGLKGAGRAGSLRGYGSVAAVPRAVNDDISFLLPRIISVGWAGPLAALRSRTVQVAVALSWAVARAESSSVVLVHMEFSVRARVRLLSLLLQATVHLPVSPQLLLKLLNCQWKLL